MNEHYSKYHKKFIFQKYSTKKALNIYGFGFGQVYFPIFVATSGWTIRPMFDQSSVSWYIRIWSLTTSRN